MAKPERVVLSCADRMVDSLAVRQDESRSHLVRLHATYHIDDDDPGAGRIIFLNEQTARELFNWLGVWLHTR